jgi:glycerol-3-phosphate dehydrogenase
MVRRDLIDQLTEQKSTWDFIIIGGGATGLGVAVDAASRGYRILLLEQNDFAKGTSGRSTKLVHGGVRYLKQGNVSLVLEALRERGLLAQNAPHLFHHKEFIVPIYNWWEGPFYGIGMKLYDRLAGKLGLSPSKKLSLEETLKHIPTVEPAGLRSGVSYYDGQFDDSRLAVNLAQTAVDHGGVVINYMPVISLMKKDGIVVGVVAKDSETGTEYEIEGRAIINATGVFTDAIRRMDDPAAETSVSISQGAHIVLDRAFLPGNSAVMIPRTNDGRVLFAVPWYNRVVVGTTDIPVDTPDLEPKPSEEEIDFLVSHAGRYLTGRPKRTEILSAFAGLRPLVKGNDETSTASLSRDHSVMLSPSGLITITGGKWTTYRRMAQDVIDHAEAVAGLEHKPCRTEHLRIHGSNREKASEEFPDVYGSDAPNLTALIHDDTNLGNLLHDDLPYRAAEIVWGARHEMARTLDDVLSRRTRALLLNARASVEVAPRVARLMAQELGKDSTWEKQQVTEYTELAKRYIVE